MHRKVTVTLRSEIEPKGARHRRSREVVVESFTLERFMRLLRQLATLAMRTRLALERDIHYVEYLAMMDEADFDVLAECACPAEPPRWFRGEWFSEVNTKALCHALVDTNDITRIVDRMDFSGKARGDKSSMEGEVYAIAKEFPLTGHILQACNQGCNVVLPESCCQLAAINPF